MAEPLLQPKAITGEGDPTGRGPIDRAIRDGKESINGSYSSDRSFTPVRTELVVVLQELLMIAHAVQVYGKWFDPEIRYVILQSALVLSFGLIFLFIRHEHSRIREKGYLRFYVEGNEWVRYYFFGIAICTCALFVLYTFWPGNTEQSEHIALAVFVTLETVALNLVLGVYFMIVRKFNKRKDVPDAYTWQTTPTSSSSSSPEAFPTTPLFEKQAMMIRHLEKQVKTLGEEIQRAKQQTRFSTSTARRGEMDALLSAKDQEIRALKVEQDRLKDDVKTTKSDLDELRRKQDAIVAEHKQAGEELERQRQQLRQLEKERTQLEILVAVHKETNAEMQKQIDGLPGAGAGPQLLELGDD